MFFLYQLLEFDFLAIIFFRHSAIDCCEFYNRNPAETKYFIMLCFAVPAMQNVWNSISKYDLWQNNDDFHERHLFYSTKTVS